jgi:hypothetical protein
LTTLLIAGGLLVALSTLVLALAIKARDRTQKHMSDRDYVVFCGATLGLTLGFLLIAYAYH